MSRCKQRFPDGRSFALWNLHTSFAEAVDKMLDFLGFIPLGVLPARNGGKIGTESKHFLRRLVRGLALSELSEHGSQEA